MLSCEAIGSVPRTTKLQSAMQAGDAEAVAVAQQEALEETINMLKSISGEFPICDGEQVQYSLVLRLHRYSNFMVDVCFYRQNRALSHTRSLDLSP